MYVCMYVCILLLLFLRDSRAGNRRGRIAAVSRIKLKFTEHAQQNAPLLVSLVKGLNFITNDVFPLLKCDGNYNLYHFFIFIR